MPTVTNLLQTGSYAGTVANNTRTAPGRPPISSFQLTLNQALPIMGTSTLSGLWVDNAGCRHTRILGAVTGSMTIDVEARPCADGDFVLIVTSINGGAVQGRCNAGPSCTFQMVRQ